MEEQYIEDVSASLVREYLARKGLKMTLKIMDEEMPRTAGSISNRVALAKEVKIEKMMKVNKEKDAPFRTMIEVMAKHLIDSGAEQTKPVVNNSAPTKKPTSAGSHGSSDDRSRGASSSPPQTATRSPKKPVAAGLKKSRGDLVLEDADESETLLGDGTDNLITAAPEPVVANVQIPTPRPRSARRGVGMAGAISSNIDERDKRGKRTVHKPMSYPQQNAYKLDSPSNEIVNDLDLGAVTGKKSPLKDELRIESPLKLRNDSPIKHSVRASREPIVDVLAADPPPRSYGPIKSRRLNKPVSHDAEPEEESILSVRGERLRSKPAPTPTRVGDIEIGDIDDLDTEVGDLEISRPISSRSNVAAVDAKPIDLQTAIDLKMFIFGSANGSFNDEWRDQSFSFCDLPELQYGIVQKKGGPCGVLASVQACFLQELLFTDGKNNGHRSLKPPRHRRSEKLATSLSNIFWRAGEHKRAVVTLPGGRTMFPSSVRYKADGLTETLTLNRFDKKDDLTQFMMKCISQFELDGNSGVVLALYSAILSRSIKSIKLDMDEADNKLMGAHCYCTQEMVNLLLTGLAASNVFNGVIELGEGGTSTILRGISSRSDIGLMSLFEHYKSCQVGTFMKTPIYPIWVICSESHFSVLFSLNKQLVNDWKAERQFDLYYYDGLMRQEEEIKLSIDTTGRFYEAPSDEDLVPPLEHCIRTKWPEAAIDWNGAEPIL
ncbi:probable ubiquitin carboxyl-terminal hydrolase MINDY-4 isoform X2 [Lineus longissimus]|uniref:probable ubiquitin carboxyl-terminal hydrolase MINDY-4 isoform X2 n=1 Tax=Lineus longissimus TaxID=88925 RepID=UPI00315D21EE